MNDKELCPHCGVPGYVGEDADLVVQLRYWHRHEGSDLWGVAADEIARLRDRVAQLQDAYLDVSNDLAWEQA